MYLENYIGHYVRFKLNQLGRENETLQWAYKKLHMDGFTISKLKSVDELGIWVDFDKEVTILQDESGKQLYDPQPEKRKFALLVKWNFIDGIYVADNKESDGMTVEDKVIGFTNK
ncbi:hypothetical protein [Sporolactobacillus putidus]|uniref:Uncharacterized protein n=1 Tax=Sporolactobacillus putidus TaxID=492735 RepID=A0A917SAF3_9BACL|nr:hypothetical protein [Sporolactobacillus putidus]GGL64369.1 hypothetical protein GCM10007968_30330 [Sporolactobacillus putidus]